MADGITRFLPQYPNIVPNEDDLLNPYDGKFYDTIYRKKEFYDLRLSKVENVPDRRGELMNHQKIITRYLSSHTPYNGILLFHEMGTGKTCSAVGAIEQIKSEGKFRGAIYIASATLGKNFLNELVETCTDGRYIPEDLGDTDRTGRIRMKKAVSDYYKLGKDYTYAKFAGRVAKMSLEEVRRRFNNHVIVIDEVHNLADNKKDGASYRQIWNFLHQVQGCKVMLLSGTPMRNKVWDIASVMNLILPAEKKEQLPTGEEFIKKYCDHVDKDLDLVTKDGANELKGIFKGRVSYLRGITSDVRRVFRGTTIKVQGIKQKRGYFKVSESIMSKFQTKSYMKALQMDTDDMSSTTKRSGYYRNSRQAALFVFPDGSWGTKGFKRYIKVKKAKKIWNRKRKGGNIWTDEGRGLKKEIQKGGINALEKYSCKYAASCRIILQAIKQNRLVFVYNESVREGGVVLFTMILKALKFTQTTGTSVMKGNTFAVLTGDTANKSAIIANFNRPDNANGDRINVIIGSQAVSEGVTFKNVQVEIVQTAWFNYARIDQALARGYRAGSHRVLTAKNKKVVQDIYLQAAIPLKSEMKDSTSSLGPITPPRAPPRAPRAVELQGIDLYMYTVAQKKDISFKKIEVIMRSAAFDCALTYRRNLVIGGAGTRECDYGNCDYECIDVPKEEYQGTGGIPAKDLDLSTYQLYYSGEKVKSLVLTIVRLFRDNFILSLQDISTVIPAENEFELLTALDTVISNSVPIHNKYGFTSYLQEENDMYFLVDGLSTIGSSSMAYYTKYPNVKTNQTFATIKAKYFTEVALPLAIRDLCRAKGDLRPYLRRLPLEYREMFLEYSVIAEILRERGQEFEKDQVKLIEKILIYFDSDIRKIGESNLIVSSLLQTHGGPLRCMSTTGDLKWHDCSEKEEGIYSKGTLIARVRLEKEDFYGQINRKMRKFCIRDCRTGCASKEGEKIRGHKLTSGLECTSYTHDTLGLIVSFYTEMPVPPTDATKRYILSNACGPPVDVKEGIIQPHQQREINKGVAQIVGDKIRIRKLTIANNEEGLREFLLQNFRRPNLVRAKYWFAENKDLFKHLVVLGGGDLGDDSAKKKKAVERGIKKMTVPQMRRLIYYGTLKKLPICMFLCAWFNSNNLLIDDNHCGSGRKPKPKGLSKAKKG